MTRETVKGERLKKEFSFRFIKRQTNTPKGREREPEGTRHEGIYPLGSPTKTPQRKREEFSINQLIYLLYIYA